MKKPNHLLHEKSPYLLQHAYNPVDWHPWGDEAFEKAKKEDKPVLLSIGYSTCHWCHVMERESFSKDEVAKVMNENFVNIKLDREERPDVDKIYMTAVQAMTGSGGWPLNVFLTPDLKPFFGGTYFPPTARWGQPGFVQILERIAGLWKNSRQSLLDNSKQVSKILQEHTALGGPEDAAAPQAEWLARAYQSYRASFDEAQGGFGGAPKFPMPVHHNFLLRHHARTGEKDALTMTLFTLRAMAKGGIYDHIGGGFHRYSTDEEWRVPHFEKMLYDNAQIAVNYLDAFQISGDLELSQIVRETLDYVLRDMTHPDGGFYSAEDADSLPQELAAQGIPDEGHEHKTEGAFYLWSEDQIRKILGADADLFIYRYGVAPNGNAPSDPHGEFTGKNILYAEHSLAQTAEKFKKSEKEAARILLAGKAALLEARAKRPRPGLDDKVLTSWNGLMLSAFAKAAQILDEPKYLAAAQKAARFLESNLYDKKNRRLYHRWREGHRSISGLADDYSFLVQGLLDLYEACFDTRWFDWAMELSEIQNELFSAPGGGFYMTAENHDENLILRVVEDYDNVEPSASSVSALNFLKLWHWTGRKDFLESAEKTLAIFGPRMRDRSMALPQMLVAADFALSKVRQVVIVAAPGDSGARALLREVFRKFLPAKIVILAEEGDVKRHWEKNLPFLKDMKPEGGKATAYVCVNNACKLPTTDIKMLVKLLAETN